MLLTRRSTQVLSQSVNPLICGDRLKTVNCEDIDAPALLDRPQRTGRREIRDLRAKQTADAAVAGLTKANEIYGLTKGQFSMLQLLQATIDRTGPVHFSLSTWTAAKWEIGKLTDLQAGGKLLSTRWLIDFTFSRRDPGAANLIRTAFGLESMRVSQVHSKFAIFGNDEWKVVLRTSMNLNMNPRMEDFTIANDPELYQFLDTFLADIWTRQRRHLQTESLRNQRMFFNDHS